MIAVARSWGYPIGAGEMAVTGFFTSLVGGYSVAIGGVICVSATLAFARHVLACLDEAGHRNICEAFGSASVTDG
ncbi:hypothetical protein [Jannaschia sp. CCS1]|uniref:hypothetical protein n=1 Tax=Jannaschia sp. (strain CCS1) TaxID=290400 RepID=UPI000301D95B|nr:hypothetical protein [Jannaschia sp. CCS1]